MDVLYYTDYLSEASRANVFFVKDGRIITPAENILKGITRKYILELDSSISVENIEAKSIYDFDEVFLTSTSRDITPVVSIDGRKIGDGKRGVFTRELQVLFKEKWM